MSDTIKTRFRGFLPVVVDVETAGFDAKKDALLELSAQIVLMDDQGNLKPGEIMTQHILPFKSANLDPKALEFNKIDPYHPFRFAVEEQKALTEVFDFVKKHLKTHDCSRAVLIGHNAWFDLGFVKAAAVRCEMETPFHGFTSFDTATLSGLVFGQTVLSKALEAANIEYDNEQAHSAEYDTKITAELFCYMVNKYRLLGGWPVT